MSRTIRLAVWAAAVVTAGLALAALAPVWAQYAGLVAAGAAIVWLSGTEE